MTNTQLIARIDEMETRLQGEFGSAFDPRRSTHEAMTLQTRIEELIVIMNKRLGL